MKPDATIALLRPEDMIPPVDARIAESVALDWIRVGLAADPVAATIAEEAPSSSTSVPAEVPPTAAARNVRLPSIDALRLAAASTLNEGAESPIFTPLEPMIQARSALLRILVPADEPMIPDWSPDKTDPAVPEQHAIRH